LPPGDLDRADARSILWGDPDEIDFNGTVLTVGDLTGDGRPDVFSGGDLVDSYTPYYVVEATVPPGEAALDDVAAAVFRPLYWNDTYALSVGDWDADGFADVSFGVEASGEWFYDGATVHRGPFAGEYVHGDPREDGSVAWFEVGAYNAGSTVGSGRHSALIPDVTGDGADDLLVSGDQWELLEFQGASPWFAGGYALFEGNVTGEHDVYEARALFHAPCDSDPRTPIRVGDLTGDGREDVAILGWAATIDGEDRGAIFVLSRLAEASGLTTLTAVSDVVIAGHSYDFFASSGDVLADLVGLGDLDGDGHDDLAVLTSTRTYVFLGPLQGFLDLNQADLTLVGDEAGVVNANGDLAAGDLDGDGVVDLVVGDPIRGDQQAGVVRVYSGAALLQAMGR
jgi:hypothetical protein